MQDDDLIRRNRELLGDAQTVRETARELAAEAAGHRFATRRGRERIRKLLRARVLWPRYLRRFYPAGGRPI